MSKKPAAVRPEIEARLRALQAGVENELKGVREWITALNEVLKEWPNNRWAQGMLRYYTEHEKELARQVESFQQKETEQ